MACPWGLESREYVTHTWWGRDGHPPRPAMSCQAVQLSMCSFCVEDGGGGVPGACCGRLDNGTWLAQSRRPCAEPMGAWEGMPSFWVGCRVGMFLRRLTGLSCGDKVVHWLAGNQILPSPGPMLKQSMTSCKGTNGNVGFAPARVCDPRPRIMVCW